MASPVTIPALQQMKRDGRKIVGLVAWDCPMAQIADRALVEIVSVGNSVGVNLWGRSDPFEVSLDEMVVVCKAVRSGVKRALVSCDVPYGPLQEGPEAALRASARLKEAGADMVKLDAAADFPETVRAVVRAGIPVFAQFGITPHTAAQYGVSYAVALAARRAGDGCHDGAAGGRGEAPGRRRGVPARFHQFRSGRGPGGGEGGRRSPCSAASAAVRGSTGGSGWRTPPSVTRRARSTPKPRTTPTSPASRSTPSPPMPATCGHRARSRARRPPSPRPDRHAQRAHRRHSDALRADRLGSAGADVFAAGFNATVEKWTTQGVYARIKLLDHLPKHTPASSSTGANAASRAAGSSA